MSYPSRAHSAPAPAPKSRLGYLLDGPAAPPSPASSSHTDSLAQLSLSDPRRRRPRSPGSPLFAPSFAGGRAAAAASGFDARAAAQHHLSALPPASTLRARSADGSLQGGAAAAAALASGPAAASPLFAGARAGAAWVGGDAAGLQHQHQHQHAQGAGMMGQAGMLREPSTSALSDAVAGAERMPSGAFGASSCALSLPVAGVAGAGGGRRGAKTEAELRDKRELRRMKNRISAARSRQRKTDTFETLQRELGEARNVIEKLTLQLENRGRSGPASIAVPQDLRRVVGRDFVSVDEIMDILRMYARHRCPSVQS